MEKIAETYNLKPGSAKNLLSDTYKYMATDDAVFLKHFKNVQMERLEYLLEKSNEANQIANSRAIIDTMNKTFSVYEQKTTVDLNSDNIIFFKFGNTIKKDDEYELNNEGKEEDEE